MILSIFLLFIKIKLIPLGILMKYKKSINKQKSIIEGKNINCILLIGYAIK